MLSWWWVGFFAAVASASALACSGGGGGRQIEIVARADACAPTSITVAPGEKVTLVVKNEAGADREVEGIEGTKLEEVLVPNGRSRSIAFTMPSSGDTQKLKCYVPGGPSTIIELVGQRGAAQGDAPVTVQVDLNEWTVQAAAVTAPSGRVRFVARNRSTTMTHELAVVAIQADGQKREVADVEGLKPGTSGEFVVDLAAGRYELACLIAPGEAGSSVDHYRQGMHTDFTVQ